MRIKDENDHSRFCENAMGFVRCMKTLHDEFGWNSRRGSVVVAEHLAKLIGSMEVFRLYTAWCTDVLCNLLWDCVRSDTTATTADALAVQAAHHLERLILHHSAESVLRKIGAEKGVDFYEMAKRFTEERPFSANLS